MTKIRFTKAYNKDDHPGRRPSMEENLKILRVEYLSNPLSDHAQFLNLRLCDQNNVYKCMKRRPPPMEDDLNWKTTTARILLKF